MSSYFSKIIKTGERQREFNFRQLPNSGDVSYSIDVPDDKGNRVVFNMQKNTDGQWKTTAENLPVWIYNAESNLGEAIEENLYSLPVKKR